MKKKKEQGFVEKIVRAIVAKFMPGYYVAHKPPKGTIRRKPAKSVEVAS